MTDRIEVRGLRVVAICGVGDEERGHPQPLVVDLDVELDTGDAATSDAVSDTVDYAPLCGAAAAALTAARPRLLETACEAVGRAVLAADGRVVAVTVAVAKVRPPIPHDVATVAVRRRIVRQVRAFLSLGSNLGDRAAWLRLGVDTVSAADPVRVSPVYQTEPVGGPDQGPFLNVVVELATGASPRGLLERCQAAEIAAGRVRAVRHGPRTLDCDVLLVGDLVVDEPDLVVPHPRMWQRRFVLQPLADLAPELVTASMLESASGAVERMGTLDAFR